MRRVFLALGIAVVVAGTLSAQDRFVFLGGFPVGANPVVEVESLPIPVFSVGAESGLFGPAKARFTVTYGFGHPIFETPCAECVPPEDVEIDPTLFDARPPLAASMDALFGWQLTPRLWSAAFGGLGMSLAPEGDVDLRKADSYRMETHASAFITYGVDVAIRVFGQMEAMTQVRAGTFLIGNRKFMPGSYEEFTADAGNVTGVVVLLGIRVKS